MAFIDIVYDEGNKDNLGYRGVEVHYGNDEKKLFESGNFVKDWFDMRKFVIKELPEGDRYFLHSSSVNHFIMDGAKFDSAWLIIEEDKTYLTYEYQDDRMEFFVEEGTKPTWEELKEICK